MEAVLSDFIARTNVDPSFAHDLLEATGWDMQAALSAFDGLNVTRETHAEEDVDTVDTVDTMIGTVGGGGGASGNGDGFAIRKRSKNKRNVKGLARVTSEIGEIFWMVAVTNSKLKPGAVEKEQVFNEQFFRHSFLCPNLSNETEIFQEFVNSDIMETSHKHTLEKSGHLNWWSTTGKLPRLEPLATSGDGNCLLHAASLYMWGLSDQNLILRTHLHRLLTRGQEKDSIKRRWQYVTDLHNQDAGGLVFSEEEWDFEWNEIIRISTSKPRRVPTTDSLKRYSSLRANSYESLEEIHVFGLAHVLKRPIIVLADEYLRNMDGEPLAPIYFGGIYLPFDINPSFCYKSPLILAYDSSHFSPLVATKDPPVSVASKKAVFSRHSSKKDPVIPLVSPNGALLPFQFAHDPKAPYRFPEKWVKDKFPPGEFPDEIQALLESYMDIRWIQLDIGSKFGAHNEYTEEGRMSLSVKVPKVRFPAAVISSIGEPDYQLQLVAKYMEDVKIRYEEEVKRKEKMATELAKQEEEYRRLEANKPVPCQGKGCSMYGSRATNNLCSKCYKEMDTPTSVIPPAFPSPSHRGQHLGQEKEQRTPPPPELIIKGHSNDDDKWNIYMPDIEVISTHLPETHSHSSQSHSHSSRTESHSPQSHSHSYNLAEPHTQTSAGSQSPRTQQPKPTTPPPPVPPKASRGGVYSRDNIKPVLTMDESQDRCIKPGCEFYRNKDTGGYCSTCSKLAATSNETFV